MLRIRPWILQKCNIFIGFNVWKKTSLNPQINPLQPAKLGLIANREHPIASRKSIESPSWYSMVTSSNMSNFKDFIPWLAIKLHID